MFRNNECCDTEVLDVGKLERRRDDVESGATFESSQQSSVARSSCLLLPASFLPILSLRDGPLQSPVVCQLRSSKLCKEYSCARNNALICYIS